MENHKKHYRSYLVNTLLPGVLYGGITGIVTGAIIFFYKLCSEWLTDKSMLLYHMVREFPVFIPILLAALVLLAIIMNGIIKAVPDASGGGIARSEGVMRGLLTFTWWKVLFASIAGSFVSFFAGLPLGGEGPSVQIGTSLGMGARLLTPNRPAWNRYMITSGASAGFAVATSAPLAGIMFAMEESHKRFSPMLMLVACSGVIFAMLTSDLLSQAFGLSSIYFDIGIIAVMPLHDFWVPCIIGVVAGLMASLMNFLILGLGKLMEGKFKKIKPLYRLIFTFLLVGTIGLLFADSLGGGKNLILKTLDSDFVWQVLLALLIVKLVLIVIATNSGATGGMFVPTLAMGAIVGGLIGHLLISLGLSATYYQSVVLLTICAFTGASMRIPVTAVVFIIEATASYQNTLFALICVFIAYTMTEVLKIDSTNEIILERILRKKNGHKESHILEFEVEIQDDSFVIGKTVRDILWLANSLIRNITRAGKERKDGKMPKCGDKKMYAGDKMLMQMQTYDAQQTIQEIEDLVGKQTTIEIINTLA